MMSYAIDYNRQFKVRLKYTCILLIFIAIIMQLISLHVAHLEKLEQKSLLLNQKATLVRQLHAGMLSITSTQYELFHASDKQQVRDRLWSLSGQLSDYLYHFHQLKLISDNSDKVLLSQLTMESEQWYRLNKDLLNYAHIIADSGFIDTLNKIDVAFSQLDTDVENSIILIAQMQKDSEAVFSVSN